MPTLSIVTTSTQRPYAFAQCQDYLARQSIVADKLYLVGEDHTDYHPRLGQIVVKRKQKKNEKLHSLCLNWLAVLPKLETDYIAVFEDDDWFRPDYLKTMVDMLLTGASLVGLQNALYYNVRQRRFQRLHNLNHASLTNTAFSRECLPLLEKVAKNNDIFLDYQMWLEHTGTKMMKDNLEDLSNPISIGIKGMPGLGGCGSFHGQPLGSVDWGGSRLRQWIGNEDYVRYAHLFEGH